MTDTLASNELIRALFWGWKLPSYNRHQALNRPDLDPVVSLAWAAIQGGSAALAAVEDPVVIDLLSIVDALPMPSKLALETAAGVNQGTQTADTGGDLAREFLGKDAALAWPDVTPGSGLWPKKPAHTCGAAEDLGTCWLFDQAEVTVRRVVTPKWHDCPACYYNRVKRYAEQVLWELARMKESGRWLLYLSIEGNEKDYGRFTTRVRMQRKRKGIEGGYVGYPQKNRYFVIAHSDIANIEGTPVPGDRAELFNLLAPLLRTPDGRRVSPSDGWGGPWQGSKGDGRWKHKQKQGEEAEPPIVMWSTATLEKAAETLGHKLKRNASRFSIRYDKRLKDKFEVYQKATEAGIELCDRRTNKVGLKALTEEQKADVTHKGEGIQDPIDSVGENRSPLCVTSQQSTAPPEVIGESQQCFDLVIGGAK